MSEQKQEKRVTNAEFMKSELFQQACANAKIPPTKRQAGKYRRSVGAAYAKRKMQSES